MLKLLSITLLALGLTSNAALAAGSEPATTEEPAAAPAAVSVTTAPAVSNSVTATPAVNWTEKWGDLGADYKAARALIEAKKYNEGIAALEALNKPEDPRVLNWVGYSHRKLGNTDQAIAFYTKALTIAPDFTPAHEYLGEAYIQANDLAKAKVQLATIEQLCGQDCEEYRDLKKSLDKVAKTRGASANLKGSSR
jgi:tetratricopeptide (TPR) repeat protein